MKDVERAPRLEVIGELAQWNLLLTSGAIVTVQAHSYGEDRGEYVFKALCEGSPRFLIEIARFPVSTVERVSSD